jgi:hypothetical protein|eukprot:COSAG02_NODE_1676_length_11364_cov_12.500755_10_plen_92_part_00
MLVDRKYFVAELFGSDRHDPLLEAHVAVDHLIPTTFNEDVRALCRNLGNVLLPPVQLLCWLVNGAWLQHPAQCHKIINATIKLLSKYSARW